jgi:HPt (histidine-containing phosphotransfer) domain-containing protein
MSTGLSAVEFDDQAFAELREDMGGAFVDFVGQFVGSAQITLDAIDLALNDGNLVEAADQAHGLRGTAGYLGALAMGAHLDAVQQSVHTGAIDDAKQHAMQARDAFNKLQGRLSAPAQADHSV